MQKSSALPDIRGPKGDKVMGSFGTPELMGREVFALRFFAGQRAVMKAIAKPRAQVALVTNHGWGKTLIQAVCSIWFPCRYSDGIAQDTAPTFKQVRGQVWKEIHRLCGSNAGRRVAWGKLDRTRFAPVMETREFRHAVGETAEEEAHFQGKHGRYLFNINEAHAVPDHIYNAIDSNRAGGDVRVLAVGNSYTTEGAFHRAFHEERDLWETFRYTVWDTPNLRGLNPEKLAAMADKRPEALDRNPWPTVSRRWVWEKLEAWGLEHPLWKIKCEAEFPDADDWQLISAAWIDACERGVVDHEDEAETAPLVVGIDPAGPGKAETACHAMRGPVVVGSLFTAAEDARGPVIHWLKGLGGPEAFSSVRIEVAGLGHYMAKHVADCGFPVVEVHPQTPTSEPDRFVDLKAQMHWQLREAFERGEIAGVSDAKTQAQLLSIRWGLTPKGLIFIEKKDDRKSPDRAESLIWAYCPVPRERVRIFGRGALNDIESDEFRRPQLAGLRTRSF